MLDKANWVAALTAGMIGPSVSAQTVPGEPVGVDLTMITGGEVFGPVLAYTDDCVVIEFRKAPHAIPWSQVETGSAYRARRALFEDERGGRDLLTAEDHFRLGLFALRRDHLSLARREFKEALRLDPGRNNAVEAALQMHKQWKEDDIRVTNPLPPVSGDRDAAPPGPGGLPAAMEAAVLPPSKTRKYAPQSPEQREQIITLYKQFGETVRARLGDELRLIETDHFLIWTDWSSVRRAGLEPWCERMYDALCDPFNYPRDENIFLGKCPIFCFRSKAGYKKFARLFDEYDARRSLGYTRTADNGHVHIVLYRPGRSPADYDRFAANLVHEAAHAFLHRFRSNRSVTGWVSEGLANLLAEQVLGPSCPNGETAEVLARVYVMRGLSILPLLRSEGKMPAHLYPLAHSLVDFLIRRDADGFALMIADMKDGMAVERALTRRYDGFTYLMLERAWRRDVIDRQAPPTGKHLP